MSSLPLLDLGEFYITNVCNYNCDQCNRLNNYYFTGHQYWKDYADVYREWSKKIDIETIKILGGEPLLNPSFVEWCYGLRELWPNAVMTVPTNGTRTNDIENLYNVLLENNIQLDVYVHNRTRWDEARDLAILQQPVRREYQVDLSLWPSAYLQVKDPSWPECLSADDFGSLPQFIQDECRDLHKMDPEAFIKHNNTVMLTDKNGLRVRLEMVESFITGPLRYAGDNRFAVYNSVPEEAHAICLSKRHHHFIRGKLYKCHHVALLPEFMEQFNVDISAEDLDLLNSYPALTVDQSLEDIQKFIDNIKNPIPQCKLCPSKFDNYRLNSSTQKIKLVKRKK